MKSASLQMMERLMLYFSRQEGSLDVLIGQFSGLQFWTQHSYLHHTIRVVNKHFA